MTQGDGRDAPEEFAHLFRPDSEPASPLTPEPELDAAVPSDPLSDWEPLVAVPQAPPEATPQGGLRFEDPPLPVGTPDEESELEGPVGEEPIAAAQVSDPKDGRLFRSRGAPERADVITAIGSMQARRLRTMARADQPIDASAVPPLEVDAFVADEVAGEASPIWPAAASGEPAPARQIMAGAALDEATASPERSSRSRRDAERQQRQERQRAASGSLTGLGVYTATIGVTVILAFGETLFFGGEPGVITGIGLLIVSVFAALTVRTYDGIHAIFAPPIAFLVATLTAGQVGINASGMTSRAVVVFFLLGGNWIWIVGSTAAALVIVALRRRVG